MKFDMLLYTVGTFDPIEGLLLISVGDLLPLAAIRNAFPLVTFNDKTLYQCRIDAGTLQDLAESIDANKIDSWDAVDELRLRGIYAGRTIDEAKLIFPELAGSKTVEIDGEPVEIPIVPPNEIL